MRAEAWGPVIASRIVFAGLHVSAKNTFGILTSAPTVQSMSWDSATGAANALASTDQALNAHGAVPTMVVNALDAASTISTPTTAAPTVTIQGTLTTAQLNGSTIGRIILHFAATASVTTASTFVWGGVDQQTLAKTSEFSLVNQLAVTFVST